ncbi:UNVERIFIED_CONTAM: hypothetical protein Sangu_1448800 [Sesamum angustifolium]|uniref:Uncharacterized protein n=1 Tax=Sesamum angustifolium TaxID=2727405 RepID=A0AAW2N8Q0_9LAMI
MGRPTRKQRRLSTMADRHPLGSTSSSWLLRERQGEEINSEEPTLSSQAFVTTNEQQLWMLAASGRKRG